MKILLGFPLKLFPQKGHASYFLKRATATSRSSTSSNFAPHLEHLITIILQVPDFTIDLLAFEQF